MMTQIRTSLTGPSAASPALTRLMEWGPARHDPENPFSVENASDAALSRFETAADDVRPDDN